MVALRLFHAFESNDGRDHGDADGFETTLQTWRNVVNGYADSISTQNEEQWRRTLLQICERIIDRARMRMATITATELDDRTEDGKWRRWMTGNVVALWAEERDVAEAVKTSVLSGAEF